MQTHNCQNVILLRVSPPCFFKCLSLPTNSISAYSSQEAVLVFFFRRINKAVAVRAELAMEVANEGGFCQLPPENPSFASISPITFKKMPFF
jgi:hypothetical protein